MTTIVSVMPVWARMAEVAALTGVPEKVVYRLCNTGKVRARKMEADKANSACVFRLGDVLEWLEEEASPPPMFKLPGRDGE